jgi:hypothetical protein
MKRVNSYMLIQWIVFLPLLLPLSIVSGALDGMRKVLVQAKSDVFEQQEISA